MYHKWREQEMNVEGCTLNLSVSPALLKRDEFY